MNIKIHKNGQQLGPFSESQIGEMLKSGMLAVEDLAWTEGMDQWKPLSSFENLQSLPAQTSPQVAGEVAPPQLTQEHNHTELTALKGGWTCFWLGGAILFLASHWTDFDGNDQGLFAFSFLIHTPLFLAAFVLSIVAIARNRIAGGIYLLLATMLGPIVFIMLGAALHEVFHAIHKFKHF